MPSSPESSTVGRPRQPSVLITGASSGIGTAVAERLAAQGRWRLLLNGRDEQRLDELAARTGGVPLAADLTNPDSRARLVDAAEAHGGVDALVAGAGAGWAGRFDSISGAEIEEVLDVNLGAVVHLVRGVVPGMLERGRGSVVLIGSVAGCVGVRNEAVYSAAKGGLVAFADSLRYEVSGDGVSVSLVMPGAVDTPFFRRRGVPYHRSRPRPVAAGDVAAAVCEALRTGRADMYVPRWLGMPARLRGAAPGVFRSLAQRFG
ncbi:SDR family NAD(P)-dependent oxidoreductase [Streptomyces sulphureus]|uniref:SDR family NAD(P)-dependent oxidoreductase n=1 Tax=Streptomyces sulphureus TaxID=47758 RepID=UPI00036BBB7A|nr:SDR family oxidoreductase [Streptomyces sulphureus]